LQSTSSLLFPFYYLSSVPCLPVFIEHCLPSFSPLLLAFIPMSTFSSPSPLYYLSLVHVYYYCLPAFSPLLAVFSPMSTSFCRALSPLLFPFYYLSSVPCLPVFVEHCLPSFSLRCEECGDCWTPPVVLLRTFGVLGWGRGGGGGEGGSLLSCEVCCLRSAVFPFHFSPNSFFFNNLTMQKTNIYEILQDIEGGKIVLCARVSEILFL
jgi:hypothetical protein